MEQYLSGAAIIERYKLAPFQLGLLINKGAAPLSPLTSEPLLCLTEPESWLHDLNVVLLKTVGLTLSLYDAYPSVPDLSGITQNSFLLLINYALRKLSEQGETLSLIWAKDHGGRKAKNVFGPLAGLFSKKEYPKELLTGFFHTNTLLYAASGNKSIWDVLQKINDSNEQWLKSNKRVYSIALKTGYEDYLSHFFLEQAHGQIEHPLIREYLDKFTPFIPKLRSFAINYHNKVSETISSRKISGACCDPASWASAANMLVNWEDGANPHRLNSLLAIIKGLRKDFFQTHQPWDRPVKITHMDEYFPILETAVFERQSIKKICDDICKLSETTDKNGHDTPAATEFTAGPDQPIPAVSVIEPVEQVEVTSQQIETATTPGHWAAIYRAHKDLSTDLDEKNLWEMMALRLEGLTGYEIFKKVFPHKIDQTPIGTAKANISRAISTKGLRLLKKEGLPVVPQLLPGKKGKA